MNKGLSIKNNIKLTSSVRVLAIFFVPFLMLLWQKGAADDIRIINAQIITMDESNPTASSLLISGNRIIDIDSNEFQESNNSFVGTVIDAEGAVVIPGLIDSHLHWSRSAITWGYALHRAENVFSLADLEQAIKLRVAEVPVGEWISLIGRHNNRQFLADLSDPLSGRYPTRQELDQWAPNHKVLLLQRFTPEPVGEGSEDYNRASFTGIGQMNSNAIGFFNSMEVSVPFIPAIPENGALSHEINQQVYEWTRANNTIADQIRSTIDLVRWSHSVGLVGVGDPGGNGFRATQDFLPILEVARRGELTVRNRYQLRPTSAPGVENQANLDALRNLLSAAPLAESLACTNPKEITAEGFHISRIGSAFFRNMGLGEWISRPITTDIAEAAIFILRRPDWSFHQHAEAAQIGNVIHGLQLAVNTEDPCRIGTLADRHSSLEHLNDATKQNLADIASLGLGAGIQAVRFLFPDWQYSGPPFKAAVETPGLNYAFGADGMFAGHGNPWTTLQFMVTGESFNGEDILTDDPLDRGSQQITLMEGLNGYTKNAAWFTREEHERGQLKAGYLADLVVLTRNPFQGNTHQIRDTKSAITIVDGKVVYFDREFFQLEY